MDQIDRLVQRLSQVNFHLFFDIEDRHHYFFFIQIVYVIIQVLTASILTHMCCTFSSKNRQFLTQRRHNSDSIVDTINNKTFSINIDDESLIPNVFT